MDGQEASLVAGDTPQSLGDQWGVEPPRDGAESCRGDNDDVEVVPSTPGAWPTFYHTFAAAVRGEGEPPVPAADAVATARVLDAARVSATTGSTISLT